MARKLLLLLLLLTPLGFYPLLRGTGVQGKKPQDTPKILPSPLTPDQRLVLGCFSIFPGQSFPAGIPWEPFRKIGEQESAALEELATKKPVEFLEHCLNRYPDQVHGYRCIFEKQEKVNGKLRAKEKIQVHFRAQPFSVHMHWLKGNDLFGAVKTLYVEGENDGLLLARPTIPGVGLKEKKLDDPQVKGTSRFPVTKFGVYIGAQDTLFSMRAAEKKGTLNVTYKGIERVKELGHRLCYHFVRTPYSPPEEDNVNELTIYIDLETLLQVGSVLRDPDSKLVAEYFFRDIELNPSFSEEQFTRGSL
jgi:Protein of unknown function (DUF1571)